MSTTITFDEIERSTESTLGHALLAKASTSDFAMFVRLWGVCSGLDILVKMLTPDKIHRMTQEQREALEYRLRELHGLLVCLGKSGDLDSMQRVPFLGSRINTLQERSEDLSDVLDNFTLIGDPGMRRLVSDCATSVGI
jgi:hypothetical protein